MKPLRLGLIGAGRWARAYVKTIAAVPDTQLVRVARRSAQPVDFLPPGTELTTDWKSVACARDLDAVIIATPPQCHAEMAEAAVLAGLPVLVEKPLTLDLEQARQLREKAVKRDVLVMVEHTHLFNPAFRAMKRISTAMGAIRSITSMAGNWGPFRKDVPILWDWGAHDIAMCLELMEDMPSKVAARIEESRKTPDGEGSTVSIELVFPKNAAVHIRLSNLLEKKVRMILVNFDTASLEFDDLNINKLISRPLRQGIARPIPIGTDLPLTVAVQEFCEKVRAHKTDHASLDLGVEVVTVLEQCARTLK